MFTIRKFFNPSETPQPVEASEKLKFNNTLPFEKRWVDAYFVFSHRDNLNVIFNDLIHKNLITLKKEEQTKIFNGFNEGNIATFNTFNEIFSKKFPNYSLATIVSNKESMKEFYIKNNISSLLMGLQYEIERKKAENKKSIEIANAEVFGTEIGKKIAAENKKSETILTKDAESKSAPKKPETKPSNTEKQETPIKDAPVPKQNPLDIEGAREYLSKKFLKENKSEWEEIKKLSVIHPALGGAIIAVDGAPTKDNVQNLQHLIGMNGNSPKNSADGILGKHTFKHIYDFIKNPTNNNKQEVDAIKKKMIFSENFKNTDPNKVWSQVLEKWNSLSDADKKNYSLISAVITENGATAENVENLQKFLKKELNFGDFAYQFDGILGNVTSGQIIAFLNRKFPETQKPAPKTEETSASVPQATVQEAEVAVPTISASAVQENKTPTSQTTAPVVEKLTPGV